MSPAPRNAPGNRPLVRCSHLQAGGIPHTVEVPESGMEFLFPFLTLSLPFPYPLPNSLVSSRISRANSQVSCPSVSLHFQLSPNVEGILILASLPSPKKS